MNYSINGLMIVVIVCAIVVMSVACCILWKRLARTEERSQALEAEVKRLESKDAIDVANNLLGRLPTMPRHKQQAIISWTKEHRPWFEKKVYRD